MKKLNNRQTKNGFTLVEVTLVTAFVSMLVIAIALIFTQISAIFQKGLTLKAVNSVGRNLVSEFTTTINSAPSIDSVSLCNMYISESEPTKRNECKNEGAFRYLGKIKPCSILELSVLATIHIYGILIMVSKRDIRYA